MADLVWVIEPNILEQTVVIRGVTPDKPRTVVGKWKLVEKEAANFIDLLVKSTPMEKNIVDEIPVG